MGKKAQFFIDDVIWAFRDVTREKPESLFDNAFFGMLKEAYDRYGVKTQLNVFYKTSNWYGNDDFSLSDMTDAYKAEFEAACDWLKLGFHAKEEWPDYPYVNADYEQVDADFKQIKAEVLRFAGENSFAKSVLPHWAPISREGIMALADNGIKITYATYGERKEYSGDPSTLPYGHSFRLLHNRKKETALYTRVSRNTAIANSICAYNHITTEQYNSLTGKQKTVRDKELNMSYNLNSDMCFNLSPLEIIEEELSQFIGNEYISVATHEQYFYPDYFAYQPDYAQKLELIGKMLKDAGYTFMFAEELPC